MRTGGGMIAFEVKGGYDAAVRLMDYFAAASPQRDDNGDVDAAQVHLCVSLGSVSTYIQHPASMTHACIPKPQRQAMGITDTLVWNYLESCLGFSFLKQIKDTQNRAKWP
jgi:methionine-gamma-lyase